MTENGFTKIPNEILEHLINFPMPGRERRILDFRIRDTWGWHADKTDLKLSDFEKYISIHKTHISNALKRLEKHEIIKVTKYGNKTYKTYRINKKIGQWKPFSKKLPKTEIKVTEYGNKSYRNRKSHLYKRKKTCNLKKKLL